MNISNRDNVIDSRDVISRIDELTTSLEVDSGRDVSDYKTMMEWFATIKTCEDVDADEIRELQALQALADAAESSPDWCYGETLVRDCYFRNYAEELAEDCGLLPKDSNRWPLYCIDWDRAARELRMGYIAVDFDGETYWIRA